MEVTWSLGNPLPDPSEKLLFRKTSQGLDRVGSQAAITLWASLPLAKLKHR